MTKPFTGRKRIRKDFGRIGEITRMPNLIEVQKSSYDQFLQIGVPAEKRESIGLQEVFRSVFPIKDFSEKAELQFVRYELDGVSPDATLLEGTRSLRNPDFFVADRGGDPLRFEKDLLDDWLKREISWRR